MPLIAPRPTASKGTLTPEALEQFLKETRSALARSLPGAPDLQPTVSARSRVNDQTKLPEVPPVDAEELDDAMHELEQFVWAYKTGYRSELDREGIVALRELIALASRVRALPKVRYEKMVMSVLLERMTSIYRDFVDDVIDAENYEPRISRALTDLGIEPTDALLEELAADKPFIARVLDADGDSLAKAAGAVETAKYTLSRVFETLGFKTKHSARSLQKVRTWSQAERARIATSQAFGSNVALPPGSSSRTPPFRATLEWSSDQPPLRNRPGVKRWFRRS
jgi:hypothetical protein